MSRTSARPDDLDDFARGSRSADAVLHASATQLRAAYDAFQARCRWGFLDASSLLHGLDPQFLDFNEQDAQWVHTIAAAFRHADRGGGIASLPDSAIAAVL